MNRSDVLRAMEQWLFELQSDEALPPVERYAASLLKIQDGRMIYEAVGSGGSLVVFWSATPLPDEPFLIMRPVHAPEALAERTYHAISLSGLERLCETIQHGIRLSANGAT